MGTTLSIVVGTIIIWLFIIYFCTVWSIKHDSITEEELKIKENERRNNEDTKQTEV